MRVTCHCYRDNEMIDPEKDSKDLTRVLLPLLRNSARHFETGEPLGDHLVLDNYTFVQTYRILLSLSIIIRRVQCI